MRIETPPEPPGREITPERLYYSRREFMKHAALTLGNAAAVGTGLSWLIGNGPPPDQPAPAALSEVPPLNYRPAELNLPPENSSLFDTDEEQTPFRDVTTYNNYYEFGLDKGGPGPSSAHTAASPVDHQRRRGKYPVNKPLTSIPSLAGSPWKHQSTEIPSGRRGPMGVPWLGVFLWPTLIKRVGTPPGNARVSLKFPHL